jgi:hypothetical protein|nr:MAG TPA: hypothetical protein [Caudoviricetes sp.]
MVIQFQLSQSDIESLLSISKLLKCDKILYDRNYINSIIGVGPERSYFQTTSYMIDLDPSINNLLVNSLDLKNLSKATDGADITKTNVPVFDWDTVYIKSCMNSLREYQVDSHIIAKDDNFHESNCYSELMAGSASTGACRINVDKYLIDIPKSAMPTLKSDHVEAIVYEVPNRNFNVLRFKITKRNGIIVNQSMLFLPY